MLLSKEATQEGNEKDRGICRHPHIPMPVCVWIRYIAPHPGSNDSAGKSEDDSPFPKTHSDSYLLMHPVYSKDYLESIYPRHKTPTKVRLC